MDIDQSVKKWGIYGTWLKDGSNIEYRKRGESNYTSAIVRDDRIYFSPTSGVGVDEVYHVTATNMGTLDFGITKINNILVNTSHRDYEIIIKDN